MSELLDSCFLMVMGGEYSFIVSGLGRWVTDKLKRSGKSGNKRVGWRKNKR